MLSLTVLALMFAEPFALRDDQIQESNLEEESAKSVHAGDTGAELGNTSMRTDDPSAKHIICPVLNALVQNHDMMTKGDNVDADTVVNSLMRAGLNQPKYVGEPVPAGITQSNAFEYTLGIFLKNKAGNYRDENGSLVLPIYNFDGTNHEHNSESGITTKGDTPFDETQWGLLAAQADVTLDNGGKCFSRDAWAAAMHAFEVRKYGGSGGIDDIGEIDNTKVRPEHAIHGPSGSWGGSWLVGKLLNHGAANGNEVASKRLVAGVAQVFNGMINLFWTGDYGNLELYKERNKMLETEEGKTGVSLPWLDKDFCLPVDELKELLMHGTYPTSSNYSAMTEEEYKAADGKVWKFPKSRCSATYFLEGGKGYDEKDACINGQPPLVAKPASGVELTALHVFFGA